MSNSHKGKVTFSKSNDVRVYSQMEDESRVSEEGVYSEMMSSIRIGNVSNMDSLEQLNNTHQSNALPPSHPQTPTAELYFSYKTDSLEKYERLFGQA